MKKWQLSKKKMLGFLTAGAIVVTMAGSYAVWDQLSDTASGSLTLNKAVTLSADEVITYATPDEAPREWNKDTAPTYKSSPVTFKAEGVADSVSTKITLSPDIKSGETSVKDAFDISIKDSSSQSVAADTAVAFDGTEAYTVEITPKDATHAGTAVTVDLTGTLSKSE